MKILNVLLVGAALPGLRRLRIALPLGQIVSVAGTYGGFEQYGATADCYPHTLAVAQRYRKWLNGGSLPRPSAKHSTTTL